jgi:CubicO group peptidase (beta-lactamase class C family)
VLKRGAWGWLERESKIPMVSRSLFWIASQTKVVASVAIMMLVEAGKLRLDDPVDNMTDEDYAQKLF